MAQTKIAVYPGSFDPITNGHIDLVERTLRVSLFSVNERLEMIQQVFRAQGKRVQADSFEGLLVDYAEKVGAGVIIRGLRAVSDFEYEFQMAMMNRELRPKLETLFMMTGESYFYISSRLVKEVVSLGGDVSALVPKIVLKKLGEKFKG
ncbi:MAG: pantetheine-phosphate adenylyltransferase [Deltaproteobacteria bacterium]|nr:pantetheine-phosphate adenylyltransferase [Deltaproteobacteria bacterium]